MSSENQNAHIPGDGYTIGQNEQVKTLEKFPPGPATTPRLLLLCTKSL